MLTRPSRPVAPCGTWPGATKTLTAELQALNADLAVLTRRAAPRLLARPGVGVETAGTLLATAGDNPGRLHSEAPLAALCGASPVQAPSGKPTRRRLNRGSDRQANNALWVITLTRLRIDPTTSVNCFLD